MAEYNVYSRDYIDDGDIEMNGNNNEILERYNLKANKTIAKLLRYAMILIGLATIASLTGIFAVDKGAMMLVMLALFVGALLPTILYDYLDIRSVKAEYAVLTVFVLIMGFTYAVLSFHVVIMFVFPVVISCLYNRRSYSLYTTAITIPVMIVSHLLALRFEIIKAEPLDSIGDVFYWGLLPRTIEFLAIAFICVCISSCNRELIFEILDYSQKIARNKDSLHSMVTESDNLIGARSAKEVMAASVLSVRSVIASYDNYAMEKESSCYAGICRDLNMNDYFLLDGAMNELNEEKRRKILTKDGIRFVVDKEEVHIPMQYNSETKKIIVNNRYALMNFYYKGKLSGYILIIQNIRNIGDEMMDLLQILYNNIDKALANVVLNNDMLNTQIELVCSLAEISEFKSEQFGQHVKRVGEYMKVVGEILDLSATDREYLSMASMLHDVGKLIIPSEILDKPDKLTEEEFEVIKTHVNVGSELLDNCPGDIMKMAKDIAYHHHEKWDGTGYMHLKGEEINYYARYVAVIDVFDALVSERSYKRAWSPQEAYDEIVSQRGKHFAPEAVDLFVNNYDRFLNILTSYPDGKAQ